MTTGSARGALTLEFLFGRGYVTASAVSLAAWAELRALKLELPALRGPIDLSGGLDRFRGARPTLHALTLRIDAAELQHAVRDATATLSGYDAPSVRWRGDDAEAVVRVSEGASDGWLGCVLTPVAGPDGTLQLRIDAPIGVGALNAPASLLVAEYFARLLSTPALQPLVAAHTPIADLRAVSFDVPALSAAPVLLGRGWKLPARRGLPRAELRDVDGRLEIHVTRDAPPALVAPPTMSAALRQADLQALDGELTAATATLRSAASRAPDDVAVITALVDLLLASGSDAAEREATDLARRIPLVAAATAARSAARAGRTEASALEALASAASAANRPLLAEVAVERARPVATAPPSPSSPPSPTSATTAGGDATERDEESALQALELARGADDDEALLGALQAAAAATMEGERAAALWREAGLLAYYELEESSAALEALRRARALDATTFDADYGALSALEDLVRDAGDDEALLAVYEARIAGTAEPEIRHVFRLTMAGVLLDRMSRPHDALRLCDDVLSEDARSIPALRKRAEALAALGSTHDAAATLDDVLEMPELDTIEAHDVRRDAARLHDTAAPGSDAAIAHYSAILESFPGDTEALSTLKQRHADAGRWDDYLSLLDRELALLSGREPMHDDAAGLERLPEGLRPIAARVLLEAASVHLEGRGDAGAACDRLQAARALTPHDPEVLEALAFAARDAGDDAMLAEALESLAPLLLDRDAAEAAREEAAAARARADGSLAQEPAAVPSSSDPLAALDAIADADDALAAIDEALRGTRDPERRHALLLRKGLRQLDGRDAARAALLPLKGALILDASSLDTRLALLRAYAALGDGGQASEQLREVVELLAERRPDDEALASLQHALSSWLSSDAAPRSDAWFAQLDGRAPAWAARLSLADADGPVST